MIKYILNLKSLLLAASLVMVICIIVGQQDLLADKRSEYGRAVDTLENAEAERAAADEEIDAEGNNSDIESVAREDGYVREDEIVFIYEED